MAPVTIVAVAGQRADRPGRRTPRFPNSHTVLVADRIRRQLIALGADVVVCSAACGADLLALAEAGALGLRRHVVLPFDAARFRGTSVADCAGDWVALFDRIVGELGAGCALETLEGDGTDRDGYTAVNRRILDVAESLAAGESTRPVALVVWDGPSNDGDSVTAAFVREVRARGIGMVEVSTIADEPTS